MIIVGAICLEIGIFLGLLLRLSYLARTKRNEKIVKIFT